MFLPVSDGVGGDADSFCNILLKNSEVQTAGSDMVTDCP